MTTIYSIMANAPVCPYCGKKKYKKTRIAKTAAQAMTKERGVPFSEYYCRPGKAWHIGRSHKSKIHRGNFHMTKAAAGLGIDPGQTGALVLVNDQKIVIYDYVSIEASIKNLRRLNREFDIQFCVLEKIWLRPDDNLNSMNILLKNFSMWNTLLHVLDIHHEEYAPDTWRKGLVSRKKRKNKKIYMEKARAIWPDQEFKRHDQAEAALMAYRAWQHIKAGWRTQKRRA